MEDYNPPGMAPEAKKPYQYKPERVPRYDDDALSPIRLGPVLLRGGGVVVALVLGAACVGGAVNTKGDGSPTHNPSGIVQTDQPRPTTEGSKPQAGTVICKLTPSEKPTRADCPRVGTLKIASDNGGAWFFDESKESRAYPGTTTLIFKGCKVIVEFAQQPAPAVTGVTARC